MIDKMFSEYPLMFLLLIVIIISILATAVNALLVPREKRSETAIAQVFKKVVSDPTSLLALLLTLLVIAMIIVNMVVPDFIEKAFFLAIGFYFGQKRDSVNK